MLVALNSLLKHRSSSRMLCFNFLSSTKWHPWSLSFSGPKIWKLEGAESGLYGGWGRTFQPIISVAFLVHRLVCDLVLSCRGRTRLIFLFGQTLQIHYFNLFDFCLYRSELIVVLLSKNHPPLACQPCLWSPWLLPHLVGHWGTCHQCPFDSS